MSFIQQLGEQTAGTATQGLIGAGMGLLLEGHNDRRQLQQQQKLQDMQIQGQKQMGLFNYEQQMKLWHETNYGAQMAELSKAGLNPALLYGTGGTGGTTAAAPAQGISAGEAPKGGGESLGLMMQQMQLGLMQAQKENIKADTANKQADTANKPIQGANVQQDTQNKIAQEALTKAQTKISLIQGEWEDINQQQAVGKIAQEIAILERTNYIGDQTKTAQIDKLIQDTTNAILTGEAIQSGIALNKATINKMSEDIAQGWRNIDISKFKAEIEANFKGLGNIAGNLIEQLLTKIHESSGIKRDTTPIKMK